MIEWDSPEAGLARTAAGLRLIGSELESVVRGGSMGSSLPAGARIRIVRNQTGRYAPGAIVAFLAGDALIAHRVVSNVVDRRGRTGVVTKGDAALICDPPIQSEIVIGEVRSVQLQGEWAAPAPGSPRKRPSSLVSELASTCVSALARVDLDVTSRALEALISAWRRLVAAVRPRTPGAART